MKQKSLKQLQSEVDLFNSQFNVGETVIVHTDSGDKIKDVIRHPATIMGGHSAMAWLLYNGSYILSRVSKL